MEEIATPKKEGKDSQSSGVIGRAWKISLAKKISIAILVYIFVVFCFC